MIRQIILWVIFYFAFTFIMSYYTTWKTSLLLNSINVVLFMAAYYTLRYWQIPDLYKEGRTWMFSISMIVGTLVCYGMYWCVRILVLEKWVTLYPEKPFQDLGEYLIRILRFYSPAMLLLVWEYQYSLKRDMIRIRELQKEKTTSELKFLKAQINPHFLFNTLNNLYSFVLTESPKASEMLTRLTSIFEYALEKSNQAQVSLKLEVDTIADYLALEEIRYGDRLQVAYRSGGNLNLQLSPLILLSIIENAFKHGASGDIDQPQIDIDIHTIDPSIYCKVWNTKSQQVGEINDAYKSGIGLSNIRRQLDLTYPNRHQLLIDEDADSFTLSLSINTTT